MIFNTQTFKFEVNNGTIWLFFSFRILDVFMQLQRFKRFNYFKHFTWQASNRNLTYTSKMFEFSKLSDYNDIQIQFIHL